MKLSREKTELIMTKDKISQKDIAERMGVSTSAVSRYFRNSRSVQNKTIGRIADALQVEVEEIIV